MGYSEEDDFFISEERRIATLHGGLEAVLDSLDLSGPKGADECFDIAQDLYRKIRTNGSKSLADKYI